MIIFFFKFFYCLELFFFTNYFFLLTFTAVVYKILSKNSHTQKSFRVFFQLFFLMQNSKTLNGNFLNNLVNLKTDIFFFFKGWLNWFFNVRYKVSFMLNSWYIWRPLVKKTSYFGLYSNSRINFLKFFK